MLMVRNFEKNLLSISETERISQKRGSLYYPSYTVALHCAKYIHRSNRRGHKVIRLMSMAPSFVDSLIHKHLL